MTLARKYIPPIGKRVKLNLFEHYRRVSPELTVWANFTVRAINTDGTAHLEHYNARDTGEYFDVPLTWIAPPVGWAERYTIRCSPEQAKQITNDWFNRGIVVRQSHDMWGSMPTAFQPMDNSAQPHWQFPEVTDAIPAADCPAVFRIIAVIEEEITPETLGFPADPNCKHCLGTGRRSVTELSNIREESPEQTRKLIESGSIQVENYMAHSDTFRCQCHWGVLSRMGRSKRAELFKQMRADGWGVKYFPYAGGFWRRRKETIVHDWEEN